MDETLFHYCDAMSFSNQSHESDDTTESEQISRNPEKDLEICDTPSPSSEDGIELFPDLFGFTQNNTDVAVDIPMTMLNNNFKNISSDNTNDSQTTLSKKIVVQSRETKNGVAVIKLKVLKEALANDHFEPKKSKSKTTMSDIITKSVTGHEAGNMITPFKLQTAPSSLAEKNMSSSMLTNQETNTAEDKGAKAIYLPTKYGNLEDNNLIEYLTETSPGYASDECSSFELKDTLQSQRHGWKNEPDITNFIDNFDITSVVSSTSASDMKRSMSKNAITARENRIRKKEYISNMKNSVSTLETENVSLKAEVDSLHSAVRNLKTEVMYLRNVIENQSTLSLLLKNTLKTPGVTFVGSEVGPQFLSPGGDGSIPNKKRRINTRPNPVAEDLSDETDSDNNEDSSQGKKMKTDHDYASFTGLPSGDIKRHPSVKSNCSSDEESSMKNSGGVCLHVSGKTVTLEFCAICSSQSVKEHGGLKMNNSGLQKVQV